jgi:hypothetical protein
MVIDNDSFTQLAVHIRRASDGLLSAAKEMAEFNENDREPELASTVDALLVMNHEFVVLERLLRAIWDANRPEAGTAH